MNSSDRENALREHKTARVREKRKKAKNAERKFMTLRKKVAANAAKKGKAMTAKAARSTGAAKAIREARAAAKAALKH